MSSSSAAEAAPVTAYEATEIRDDNFSGAVYFFEQIRADLDYVFRNKFNWSALTAKQVSIVKMLNALVDAILLVREGGIEYRVHIARMIVRDSDTFGTVQVVREMVQRTVRADKVDLERIEAQRRESIAAFVVNYRDV